MGLHCSGRARWDGASVSQTPIKPDGETYRGIIDSQEKGSLLGLITEKKENQSERAAERRRSEGREGERGVTTCNMLPRANSDYIKCLAHTHTQLLPIGTKRAKKRQ